MSVNGPIKLKRAVIKEEYVALTGSVDKALILNQFIYWSERVRDFDLFIKEENARKESHREENLEEFCHGWIYKTAQELSEETMLSKSPQTMRRLINDLVKQGWLQARRNPKYKWDQTYQYRVNLHKIQSDLFLAGYPFDGYKYCVSPTSKMEVGEKVAISILENGESKMEIRALDNGDAIPETTTEIEEEERAKITAEEKVNFQRQNSCQQNKSSTEDPIEKVVEEKVNSDKPGIGLEFAEDLSCSNSAVSVQSVYEEPPSLYKGEMRPSLGDSSEDLVEMVMKKLNIDRTLAFLVAARCRDKELLEKVIDQLISAKKPIRNMTAYLLTLIANYDRWDLFIENVEKEFLTKERPKKPKKKRREKKPLEEEREIYIPPSMG